MEPDGPNGGELRVGVTGAADGRRRLHVDGKDPDMLLRLPQCQATVEVDGDG